MADHTTEKSDKKTDKKTDENLPPENKNAFKITDQYLIECAKKVETFLNDLQQSPWLLKLRENWATGTLTGDDGKLLPGSTVDLDSARAVQANFISFCKQLNDSIALFERAMHSTFVTLNSVKILLQNAEDEAVSATKMWDVLTAIEQGFQKAAPTAAPETS